MKTKIYNTKEANTPTLASFAATLFFWHLSFNYDQKEQTITVENVTDKALVDINSWLKGDENFWNEITELK